jgi:hypothetical protein
MAQKEFRTSQMAALLALLLLFQPTLLAFSGSGMETSLNLLLWLGTIRIYQQALEQPPIALRSLVLGAMLALCLLSRPDSIILAAILPLHYLLSGQARLGNAFLAFFACTAIVLPYLLWKQSHYGSLLPNTFISKSGGADVMKGLKYLGLFGIWTLLPLAIVPWLRGLLRPSSYKFAGLGNFWAMLALAWMAYIFCIGGDFMEFRMMAPAIPGLLWLALKFADEKIQKGPIGHLAWILVVLMQAIYWIGFGAWGPRGFVQPVAQLRHETGNPKSGLIAQGHTLEVFCGLQPQVIMATGGAGAQAYCHDLPTIDMIGLNDARVAREGLLTKGIPGHARFATYDYLVERQVNIVVGGWPIPPDSMPPAMIPWDDQGVQASFGNFNPSQTTLQPSLLLIPVVGSDWRMVSFYLWPHLGIDSLIQAKGWPLHPIR